MTTNSGDNTIHIADNQPVSMPRTPQLGDTRVHFGGEPFVRSDTTESMEKRPKGLDLDASGFEAGGSGQILGGHESPTFTSPEKNILQTPEELRFSNWAWTNGVLDALLVRDAAGELHVFTTEADMLAACEGESALELRQLNPMNPEDDAVEGWVPAYNHEPDGTLVRSAHVAPATVVSDTASGAPVVDGVSDTGHDEGVNVTPAQEPQA